MLPNIQIKYPDSFPDHFINDVNGWAFSQDTINANEGKLLTLDIDFGSKCSLHCPHCFKRGNNECEKNFDFDMETIKDTVLNAKSLGLKSIKIVGKGEPFETPKILDFFEFLNKCKITPLVFTKGHILGNEDLVRMLYKPYGIGSCDQLITRLYELGVSVLLGFNSISSVTQDKMVGNVNGYTDVRNRALELLINAGFNKGNPTRLGLILAPLTNDNYNDAFEIYVWARRRNLYPVITPTMVSGHLQCNSAWKNITPSEDKLIDLYSKIYKFNIDKKIQTFHQIKFEGISAYAGVHPCNQVSAGMYITYDGTVLSCPGNDSVTLGNINHESLADIWSNHNSQFSYIFNNGCPAKCGKSIPSRLFDNVLMKLTKNQG